MIVSHNELVAAVNKAFLGMRRHCGEADVIANMVADLQMVGLNGVRHFNNASQFLNLILTVQCQLIIALKRQLKWIFTMPVSLVSC